MTANDAAARVEELEADNRRLRRLLAQKDAPEELRHRLKNTLAMLRMIIRKSANTERDMALYSAHVENRLDAIARAQATADSFGEVDLGMLLANELLDYDSAAGDRVHLSGPRIQLQPRAGQVFALAVHELAVNALEHGALTADGGSIDVSWKVAFENDACPLTFSWTERGLKNAGSDARNGFGTEVLTRMLPYELGAQTTLSREAEGLQCIIRVDLTDRIGRVDAQETVKAT